MSVPVLNVLKEIRDHSVLRYVPEEALPVLAQHCRIERVKRGESFIKQGAQTPELAILVKGEASLYYDLPDGKVFQIEDLKSGRSVDLSAVLLGTAWHQGARTRTTADLLWIDKTELLKALSRNKRDYEYIRLMTLEPSIQEFTRAFKYSEEIQFSDVRDFLLEFVREEFRDGEVLLEQDKKISKIYLLKSGTVRISQHNSTAERQLHIRDVTTTSLLGNENLAEKHPVSIFRYSALGSVQTWAIPVEAYQRFLTRYPFLKRLLEPSNEARAPEARYLPQHDVNDLSQRPSGPDGDSDSSDDDEFEYDRDGSYKSTRPIVLQKDEMDCGAACMAMIAKHFGVNIGIRRFRDVIDVGTDGASLYGIAMAAEKIGLLTRGLKLDLEDLEEIRLPVITTLGYHFVVIYEVTSKEVIIGDPGVGLRKLPNAEFAKEWSGAALLFNLTPEFFQNKGDQESYGHYVELLRPYFPMLGKIIFLSLMVNLLALVGPVLAQILFDKAIPGNNIGLLKELAIAGAAGVSLVIGAESLRRYLMNLVSLKIETDMSAQFMRHLFRLTHKFFFTRRTGDILMRLADIHNIQAFITSRGIESLIDVIMLASYGMVLAHYHMGVAMVFAGVLLGFIALCRFLARHVQRNFAESLKRSGEAHTLLVESIKSMATIKSYRSETSRRWAWEQRHGQSNLFTFKTNNWLIVLTSAVELVAQGAPIGIQIFGAALVLAGKMTVGQVIALSTIFLMALTPLLRLTNIFYELQQVLFGLQRLNDIFEATPEETIEKFHPPSARDVRGSLRFEEVCFRYGNEESPVVLNGVNFEVGSGEVVALVGRNGSGKSSIAQLVNRLFSPFGGRILIDEIDIRDYPLSELRKVVAIVSQDTKLFSGTILENIAFGDGTPDLKRAIQAAKQANAHQFIRNQPFGYHQPLLEDGMGLSGGEKQRISLARALYHNPKILILDEASSALDPDSESAFNSAMNAIAKHRAVIQISHRLSTIKACDRVIVLDAGKVIETGRHTELVKEEGAYAQLVRSALR